ncbi:craniofacial development protein 1 [Microtus ochrogaster]|uniref:Craniofacial development protein 1 n=1 Tax=Microtus ochrogaster TaxID=79684 RepID=A0ABM0KG15_MICOH|nr:craniofacial development protein 1 [Microtus ochrogaster]
MEEFDSEDFSTSDEDEDYVPSGGEYSEDDVNELVKEDEVDGDEQAEKTKGKRRKTQSIPARKRKQSGLLLEDEEEDGKEESGGSSSEEDEEDQDGGLGSENARKKKEDELWASFLNDVGPKAKAAPSSQVKAAEETEETSSNKLLVKAEELEKPKESEKVKITKVFDFAGEEVRVTKEVDAASKEAKSFLKQNEKEKPQAVVPSAAAPALPAGSGIKRSSGMSSLLGKIGAKKQKMSTLEKSKLDWENFKEEEGIGEELAIHNRGKEGYIERKAFLDRVDHRQFEIERDLRLSKMKP